jgi:hypothetical protein
MQTPSALTGWYPLIAQKVDPLHHVACYASCLELTMYTQSPRFGIPHAAPSRRAREGPMHSVSLSDGTADQYEAMAQGRAAQLATGRPLTLSDLHTLVVNLEARMVAQEEKIADLQQENSNLWQEIHRVSRNGSTTFSHGDDGC